MKADERENFLKWYEERVNNGYVFYFNKELMEYFRSDVDILRKLNIGDFGKFDKIANSFVKLVHPLVLTPLG